MDIHIDTSINLNKYIDISMHTYGHTYMHAFIHKCIYLYTYIYIYIYIYIYRKQMYENTYVF